MNGEWWRMKGATQCIYREREYAREEGECVKNWDFKTTKKMDTLKLLLIVK